MTGIFLSYRQADAKAWAISLRDELVEVFGEEQVFLDKDTLHAGNWREQIQSALDRCKVMLVVMGPRWLTIADEQDHPRIELADDVHRQEIALALSRSDLTVIPVLVDEAVMPRANQLPPDLQKLADHQARKIGDTQARRKADLAVLVKDIQSVGGIKPRPDANVSERPGTPPLTPVRTGWLGFDRIALYSAFVLTVATGVCAYLVNAPLETRELFVLLVVFYALVNAGKWLWVRAQSRRGRRT
jgi:TIR domain